MRPMRSRSLGITTLRCWTNRKKKKDFFFFHTQGIRRTNNQTHTQPEKKFFMCAALCVIGRVGDYGLLYYAHLCVTILIVYFFFFFLFSNSPPFFSGLDLHSS